MKIDELRDLRDATPFHLFAIHLADGRAIRVVHRDFVMASPTGRTGLVYQSGGSLDIVDMMLVTSLRVKPSNGHAAGKSSRKK